MKSPLYNKIYNKIRFQIDTGVYSPGSMLPTEQELSKRFNMSRAPVRQALGMLESEGIIRRCPGKGTFVSSPPEGVLLWFNFSPFRDCFAKNWDHISIKTFTIEMRQPPAEAREFLMLGNKEQAIYIERVRYCHAQPVILHQHYIQPTLNFNVLKDLGELVSLRGTLRNIFSVEITRIVDSLRAVLAPEDVAPRLETDTSSPVLCAERRSYSHETPFQFDYFYTRTDIWDYNVAFEKGINGTTTCVADQPQPA